MKLRGTFTFILASALAVSLGTESFAASSAASLAPIADCQIKDARITQHQPNNVGFPHSDDIIPVVGQHTIAVIPIDFADVPGTSSFLKTMNGQFKKYQEWYSFFSQGKASAKVYLADKWFRAPKKSTEYNLNKNSTTISQDTINRTMNSIAQEFINTPGNYFDYGDIQGVFFYFPQNYAGGIEFSILGRGVNMQTPQGTKNLFFFSPGIFSYEYERNLRLNGVRKPDAHWYGLWVHEILHSQGLAIHAPGNGFNIGTGQMQDGYSVVLDSWETFLLGWYNDNQVFCAPKSKLNSSVIEMQPIETKGAGYKIGVVPLDAHRALVIESRRPVGYTDGWAKTDKGLFVSILDTTKDNDRSGEATGDSGNDPKYDKWSFLLLPDRHTIRNSGRAELYRDYLAKVGDTVTYEGVRIKLLRGGSTDRVQISKLN